MELGARLKQARLEAGLSQRQLCGEKITRNMLSRVENGAARPSMDTLRYLAERLGKPISYFLEDEAVLLPNQALMDRAREAWDQGNGEEVLRILAEFQDPDPVFDREKRLLEHLARLRTAREEFRSGRGIYAGSLLTAMAILDTDYCAEALKRERMLLLAKVFPKMRQNICGKLPSMDEELLIRAEDALDRGDLTRCADLLDAAEDQESPDWNFLRGEAYLAAERYAEAAGCYHKAEAQYPEKTADRLEQCYRELEDYRQAYFYACKQR